MARSSGESPRIGRRRPPRRRWDCGACAGIHRESGSAPPHAGTPAAPQRDGTETRQAVSRSSRRCLARSRRYPQRPAPTSVAVPTPIVSMRAPGGVARYREPGRHRPGRVREVRRKTRCPCGARESSCWVQHMIPSSTYGSGIPGFSPCMVRNRHSGVTCTVMSLRRSWVRRFAPDCVDYLTCPSRLVPFLRSVEGKTDPGGESSPASVDSGGQVRKSQ